MAYCFSSVRVVITRKLQSTNFMVGVPFREGSCSIYLKRFSSWYGIEYRRHIKKLHLKANYRLTVEAIYFKVEFTIHNIWYCFNSDSGYVCISDFGKMQFSITWRADANLCEKRQRNWCYLRGFFLRCLQMSSTSFVRLS